MHVDGQRAREAHHGLATAPGMPRRPRLEGHRPQQLPARLPLRLALRPFWQLGDDRIHLLLLQRRRQGSANQIALGWMSVWRRRRWEEEEEDEEDEEEDAMCKQRRLMLVRKRQ